MVRTHLDDLRLAHLLADDADSVTMDRFRSADLHVSAKPDTTLVSDADRSVEEAMRRMLSRARPRDAVLGEEAGVTGWGPRRWVLDPIDGTHNFVRGVPVWASLVALMQDDEVVVGCVSAPALSRRWWASEGGGAWTGKSLLGARPCRVSDVTEVSDASFSYSSLGGWDDIGRLDAVVALTRRCWRSRAYGDFWSHMLVAEGAVDIAAEPALALHDMAALEVVVTEAGGRFSGLDGRPGPLGQGALSTNGRLHDAAMAFVGHFPDDGRGERPEPRGRPDPAGADDSGGSLHDLASRRRDPRSDP
ncbi:MAG: histidinol phosphatase [Actinomycetota bacterium]|nr:histidinol phosphatase [Actinomycetota bacterium]